MAKAQTHRDLLNHGAAGKGDKERSSKWRDNYDEINWGSGTEGFRQYSTGQRKIYSRLSAPVSRRTETGNIHAVHGGCCGFPSTEGCCGRIAYTDLAVPGEDKSVTLSVVPPEENSSGAERRTTPERGDAP